MYKIAPTKFNNKDTRYSIYDHSSFGPSFGAGCDISIFYSNYTDFPNSYKDVLGKGYSIFKGDNDDDKFNLTEIEVFKLIK